MNRTLLDTDTLSEINKAHDAALVATATAYLAEHGRFTLSAVNVMEAIRATSKQAEPNDWLSFSPASPRTTYWRLVNRRRNWPARSTAIC